jgi:TolB protein
MLPVSAQRNDQRDILFDSRMGPTPASLDLGPDKGQEIWVIRSDGSRLRRMTESPSEDTRNQTPRWSPDGGQIAFSSTRHAPSPQNTDADIYVMNHDGSALRRLTYGPRQSGSPEWSPNGKRIAFTSDGKIYVMDANGSNRRRLMTDEMLSSQVEATPAWSPDGERIAFSAVARDDVDYEIYILELETSTLTQLTDNNVFDAHVAWSPDGQYISFNSDRDGNSEIYVMRPDGSQVVRLTNHARMDNAARWSRDGQRLAFNSTRDSMSDSLSNMEIYVMNRDGSGLRRLTNNAVKDTHPDW